MLLEELKEQLKSKRMVYSKDQLELSSTVGQGNKDICLTIDVIAFCV